MVVNNRYLITGIINLYICAHYKMSHKIIYIFIHFYDLHHHHITIIYLTFKIL
jgi:hypothetical protein